MNSHDDNLLNEYGVETFEEMVGEEQDAPAGQNLEGKTPVALGDATFYLKISEKSAGLLSLLTKTGLTAAERYKLADLLKYLKNARQVKNAAGQDFRRDFLSALREREAIAANRIRQEEQGIANGKKI